MAPTTQQQKIVVGLLQDYQHHALSYAQAHTRKAQADEKQAWQSYMDQRAANDPLAYSVINAVFKRLDASGILQDVGGSV